MKILVLILTGGLLALAGGLFALSFRRETPMLGLAGLGAALAAAALALPISAFEEF